jgi:uncharacterized protein YbjT (DUF2867 family)
MEAGAPTILVLGASGLIGSAVAMQLRRDGFRVVPVARRFIRGQKALFGAEAVENPVVDLDPASMREFIEQNRADIVINCIGVLQDSRRGGTEDVHQGFVGRLVEALSSADRPCLLINVSVPGRDEDDRTSFSRTKHAADAAIAESGLPYVILRPGFVIASAAYGGSALMRALAALPFRLPDTDASRPFASVDIADLARTVAALAHGWRNGQRQWSATWDLMEREPRTLGGVIAAFRHRLEVAEPHLLPPGWLMDLGARLGDLAALLGWSPPIRTTALAEMRRGVGGDPGPWIDETGIEPSPLEETLSRLPPTVQEKWFARLYLLKPLVLGCLSLFWTASGLIALFPAFWPATTILTEHGFAPSIAAPVTVASSLADILVGAGIAMRRTCRTALIAGIALSLFYMLGAAIITPDMWIEPLGALVKTAPAIVLMMVALAILDDR